MSDQDSIEERVARLLRLGEGTAVDFVLTELTTGIISCKIARTRRDKLGLDYTFTLQQAQLALYTAEKFMWRFRMKHPEFDQMTALAERLRMELDSLKHSKE